MRQILKYELNPGIDRHIELSAEAKVVFVAEQRKDYVTIWIETDRNSDPQMLRQYAVIGTGHPIPIDFSHVGSAICEPFVWHVYEAK